MGKYFSKPIKLSVTITCCNRFDDVLDGELNEPSSQLLKESLLQRLCCCSCLFDNDKENKDDAQDEEVDKEVDEEVKKN